MFLHYQAVLVKGIQLTKPLKISVKLLSYIWNQLRTIGYWKKEL